MLFLVLFGCFEWCRYVDGAQRPPRDAVREGSRYALARTDTLQTGVTTGEHPGRRWTNLLAKNGAAN